MNINWFINNYLKHLFVLINICSYFIAKSQSKSIVGIFPTIDHSGKLSKRIDYNFYYFSAFPLLNFKEPNLKQDAEILLFYAEQGLTYHLNKKISFSAAYVFQKEAINILMMTNEHRLHVQSTFKHALKQLNFKHRIRFDNRFVVNWQTGEKPFTHRLRYLIGIETPIKKSIDKLYFTAYQEAFFNTFKSANKVYAENWAYAALGVKLNKSNKLEAGPLYITWDTGNKNWFHQYYLQLSWVSQLDFTRAKQ
ncbi:MAG: DUF2490 domain-containing protein [Bacteroidota bacterium]|nr:DUF2490 domain-containing protein [Bacteroidota bacterium]